MLKWQKKLGPLQDKLFKYMRREIEDMEESDQWKLDEEEEQEEEEEDIR